MKRIALATLAVIILHQTAWAYEVLQTEKIWVWVNPPFQSRSLPEVHNIILIERSGIKHEVTTKAIRTPDVYIYNNRVFVRRTLRNALSDWDVYEEGTTASHARSGCPLNSSCLP
jgi:hypothetical protein